MCFAKKAKILPDPKTQTEGQRSTAALQESTNRRRGRGFGREQTIMSPLGDSTFGQSTKQSTAGAATSAGGMTVLGGK